MNPVGLAHNLEGCFQRETCESVEAWALGMGNRRHGRRGPGPETAWDMVIGFRLDGQRGSQGAGQHTMEQENRKFIIGL
jgi:hypothetical protein